MQIPGRYCVLVSLYSVLELYVLRIVVGFWVMDVASILKLLNKASDTGFGFFLRASSSGILNGLPILLLFLVLPLIIILHFSSHFKGLILKNNDGGVVEVCASIIPPECSQSPIELNENDSISHEEESKPNVDADTDSDGESEVHDEDEEIDVEKLRKLVKIERGRADFADEELERERRSSEIATEEAMAMILRLQTEKSSVEMEANQFRRITEKKEQYAEEVIKSLQKIKMQKESQISLLEDQVKLYREKLRQFIDEDEIEQFEDDSLIS